MTPPPTGLQEQLQAAGVHTLLVQFTDLHGAAKGKLVPLAQLPAALHTGAGFAGPSITGTGLPRTWPLHPLRATGIGLLPQPLAEALAALEADEVISAALGPTLTTEFLRLKRDERTGYARHVGDWELDRYAAFF